MIAWPGPLFYPPVGMIAVTKLGARIVVWPDESESAGCFTGLLLREGSRAQRVVHDLSVMWARDAIDHVEQPTKSDEELMAI